MKDTTMRDCSIIYLSLTCSIKYQMIAIFPAPNGRVDEYTDKPHKLIYPS